MNSLAKEVGDGIPVAGAGIKSSTSGIYSQCFLASFLMSLQHYDTNTDASRRHSWKEKNMVV
jgi:hypothetical protein